MVYVKVIMLILTVLGVFLSLYALRYRTPKHPPIPSWSPKDWKPIWRMKECFTPRGFKIHMMGWALFFLGMIGNLILSKWL